MSPEIISIFAITISIISLIVSVLNYRRDNYKVYVSLDWDAGKYYVGMQSNVKETWGTITVTNRGRRAVYIKSVGIKYPDDERVFNLLGQDKLEGEKLSEADPPIIIKIPQDGILKKYSKDWLKLYAVAYDIKGKEYKSEKSWNTPSWAE
jgi:hypothetical protein